MQVMDLKARTVLLVNKKTYESSTEKTAQQKKISKKAGRSFTWNLYRSSHFFGMEKSIFLRNLQQDPLNGPLNLSI